MDGSDASDARNATVGNDAAVIPLSRHVLRLRCHRQYEQTAGDERPMSILLIVPMFLPFWACARWLRPLGVRLSVTIASDWMRRAGAVCQPRDREVVA